MSFAVDPSLDVARQVGNALEDESAQPLAEVQRCAPDGCHHFSELEASISEWAFGYGVAWALARTRDPLLGSSATAELAEHAVRDAWRSFSGQSWTTLMGEDRARRGPVDGDAPQSQPQTQTQTLPASPLPAETPSAPLSAAPEMDVPEDQSQYGDFMGKVARSRPRRPPPRDG